MNQRIEGWRRTVGMSLLTLLLVGCSFVPAPGAAAQERVNGTTLTRPNAAMSQRMLTPRFEQFAVGFQRGGTLGFQLRETPMDEQMFRREEQGARGVLWSAQFTSRWTINEEQLDRWSAQAIGLLADNVGPEARLAGWERLEANDIGDARVAYRYLLADSAGQPTGEATVVVYAQGREVLL